VEVIAAPPDELLSETNDNPVATLLTYGTACVLLAGDAEAREKYMGEGSYTEPLPVIKV
jgi:beta-lactamase superfamily II metal-dependent hydrolase